MKRLALLVLVLAACDGDAKREAQSLATAVERFHRADNRNKAPAAATLRAVTCRATDVCAARAKCVAAADAWGESMSLTDEVIDGLAKLENGTLAKESPEAQALVGKRDRADKRLDEAQQLLPECDDAVRAIKRAYGI